MNLIILLNLNIITQIITYSNKNMIYCIDINMFSFSKLEYS